MGKAARPIFPALIVGLFVLLTIPCWAEAAPAPKTFGWRGNWTGLFPDAAPPVEWARIAKGVFAGTTCQAAKPAHRAPKSGQPVANGLLVKMSSYNRKGWWSFKFGEGGKDVRASCPPQSSNPAYAPYSSLKKQRAQVHLAGAIIDPSRLNSACARMRT